MPLQTQSHQYHFPQFLSLPPEVRDMVWTASCMTTRAIRFANYGINLRLTSSHRRPHPTFHVCKESREVAINVYSQDFCAQIGVGSISGFPLPFSTSIYVNLAVNFVVLDSLVELFRGWPPHEALFERTQSIKRVLLLMEELSICTKYEKDILPIWNWMLKLCPNVDEVGILLPMKDLELPVDNAWGEPRAQWDHCVEPARQTRRLSNLRQAQEDDFAAGVAELGLLKRLEDSKPYNVKLVMLVGEE